jgi:hypothetical protein
MATLTVKQSGGDHSTLASALSSAIASDTISIEGSWTVDDTTNATVADDNLTIQTDASSKHPGYWDEATSQHYRLVETGGDHALTLNGAYTCTIDGLAIEQASSGGISDECFRCVPGTSDTVTVKNCLFYLSLNVEDQDGIYTGFNTNIGTVTIENSVIIGAGRGGVHSQNGNGGTGALEVNSCTFWLNGRYDDSNVAAIGGGIMASGNGDKSGFTIDVHNTIAVENDTGTGGGQTPQDIQVNGTGNTPTYGISYSIDSDNTIATYDSGGAGNLASRTATDSTSPGAGNWVIFEDITSAPYDLRIVDNAEDDAQDDHTTATAEGLTIPSTDIVGTSRPQNTNYDIGAFEIVSAGDPAPNVSDDATVTDSVTVTISDLAISVQDDATVTDSIAADVTTGISAQDDATITDSVTVSVSDPATLITDNATIADSVNLTVSDLQIGVQDDATITDSDTVTVVEVGAISIAAQDDATLTDSVTVSISPSILTTDNVTVSDSVNMAVSDLQIGAQDDATLTDSPTVSIGAAGEVTISVQDDATVTDTVTLAVGTAQVTISDDATVTDSATVDIPTEAALSVNISPQANYVQIV